MTVLFCLERPDPMIDHPRRATTSPLANGIRRSLSLRRSPPNKNPAGSFTACRIDHRTDYAEARITSLSELENTLAVVVVHTNQTGVCQIFPGRQASKQERKNYDEELRTDFDAK